MDFLDISWNYLIELFFTGPILVFIPDYFQ